MKTCSVKGCAVTNDRDIVTIDDGTKLIAICSKHTGPYAYYRASGFYIAVNEYMLDKIYASERKDGCCKCLVCGMKAVTCDTYDEHRKRVQLSLCESHLNQLMRRDLDPDAYQLIKERIGILTQINSEFYTETGIAINPIRIN